jgi:Flp pilus assembly protein TadD
MLRFLFLTGGTALITMALLNVFSSLFFIVTMLILLAMISRARLEDSRGIEANQHAIALLNDGQVDEAARAFQELARSFEHADGHAVYVFNTGVSFMLQGNLRRAFAVFNAVKLSRRFGFGPHSTHEPLLHAEMSACAALLGWTDEAQSLRARAFRRLSHEEHARLALTDAILALRAKDPRLALEVIRRHGPSAEGLLRPPTIRALMILRAFALEELRAFDEADQAVRRLMPIRPAEFVWLGAEWPEMRAFLAKIQV